MADAREMHCYDSPSAALLVQHDDPPSVDAALRQGPDDSAPLGKQLQDLTVPHPPAIVSPTEVASETVRYLRKVNSVEMPVGSMHCDSRQHVCADAAASVCWEALYESIANFR